jgi:hypothetical protein
VIEGEARSSLRATLEAFPALADAGELMRHVGAGFAPAA